METNYWQGRVPAFCRRIIFSVFATVVLFCHQAHAQQCEFYPIALSAQQLSNAAPGTVLNDIYNGVQPGNFGWLTWGGSPSESTLVNSLAPNGNSATYVNPDNPADHQISIGDWVSAKPGVSNSKSVRNALDALKAIDITVPVWNQTRGSGDHAAYRIANFARVRLISYQLPGQNRIAARFLGFTTCANANLAPVVYAGADITTNVHDVPATITLNGSVTDDALPSGTLTSSWSLLSGPGTVTFANSAAPVTTATLSAVGTYVLQLSATDGELASSNTVIVTVNRENQAPQAYSQTIVIDEDTTTNMTLLGGDPDNDSLTFQVVTLPQFGTLVGTPPNVTYAPKQDYNGQDSFTFKVNDGQLDSAPATVSITIQPVNDAPVADSISVTNSENSSVAITLSGSDVEGSALTFILLSSPAHGTLDVQAGTLSSPQVIYTSDTNFSGNDSFTFKVNDGLLDSATATVSITNAPVNLPPDVDAGLDQIVSEPANSAVLQGVVTDDNFFGYDSVTVEWTKVSGPGAVTFTDATSRGTVATFDQPGVYVLRLTASDSVLESSDDVQITFNGAPVVSAGVDQTNTLPATVTLNGTTSDDGLPTGSVLTVSWDKVSGPGTVVFGDAHDAATTASFSESGVYVLRLAADDSLVSRSSDVTVTINAAPIVDAGADQVITNLQTAIIGTVYDDGLPSANLTSLWTKVSGPGDVTFADTTSPATTVTFSASGVYVLQLIGDDSLAQTSGQITIVVDGAPLVTATSDSPINFPGSITVTATASDDGLPAGSTLSYGWTKVSGPGAVSFADPTALQTTVSLSESGTYVFEFTATDSLLTTSRDITVIANSAPIVSAGANQLITLPQTATLNGSVTDDGLPNGTLTITWSQVSGPGTTSFADPSAATTTASFSASGIYVLRLTANDGLAASSSNVTITVNTRPSVSITADNVSPRLPQAASLVGTISDDGLPNGALSYAWTQVSGPGTTTFSNPTSPSTTATFTQAGLYTLRLTADDGAATGSGDITLNVLPENHPPVVDAGSSQTVNFPNVMILHGTVTDDGVPIGSPNIAWSQLSGPGTITFGDVHSATTSASASDGGVYVLRLTADDTLATNSADVTVKFNRAPIAQPQSVTAPEGQTTPITLIGTDPDGDGLQFFAVQTPQLGILSGNGSNLTYTANVGTYGADTFAFYVTDGMLTSSVATVSIQVVPFGRGRTYTANEDFQSGSLTSLVATNGQLQSVIDLTHFNYVWVAMQNRGTVVRLDGETGRPLGEYRLYPDGRANGFPSRMAIDSQGNCWVGNERDNSVVMIATPETGWIDKNHNGVLDTSQGQGDIRPWTNPGGVDSNGGVSSAQDELVVRYVRISDTGARFVAVTGTDDVWVGGTEKQVFDLIDHVTGNIIRTEPSIGRGGFGGFVDQSNVLWSAGTFLRWDTTQPLSSVSPVSWNQVPSGSFACAQDASGNIWVTYEYGWYVYKYGPDGSFIGQFPNGDRYGQGIAIDSNGDVWIAHSHCGHSVGHLKNDGTYLGSVITAKGPTDVSIDRKGRVWVTTSTGVVQRINPLAGPLGNDHVTPVGALEMTSPFLDGYLWTYGNFTGGGSASQTQRGVWSTVFDSGLTNAPWAGLSWDALIGNDGDLRVSVATSADGTNFSPLQPITLENSQPTNTGRYLEIVVNFVPATSGEGPTLQDINVGTVGWPVPAATPQWQISAGGNVNAYWPDAVQLKGVVWHSAHKIAVNPTIQWSLVSGPGTVTFDNPTNIQPTVRLSKDGTYHFRVTANNNGEIKADDMTLTTAPYNRAPFADAGPNLFVQNYATGSAVLQGDVRDDGLPLTNTLKIQWSQLFGPGTTTFANPTNTVTTATFSTNGIYVLQLSGDDGEFVSKALVTVRVGMVCTVDNVPNLEAWWQANATGDDHVNGNQAFLENGANYIQGMVGPAFNFDGIFARASVGANPHINLAKSSNPGFSVEFWMNPNAFSNGVVMGWTNGVRFERVNGGNIAGDTLNFDVTGTTNGALVNLVRLWSGTNTLNQWYHIAGTWERSSGLAKLYLNGVLQNSAVVGTNVLSTANEFYMGQVPGFLGAFKGQLDEVSLYSRTLTPEEVYNIYASGAAGKCPLEGNQAPTVSAGPDLFLRGVPATTTLNGQVFDDGLPVGSSVQSQWSKLSGPGTVTFADPTSPATTATFSTNGVYVLQLSAYDGDVLSTSLVEVRVETLCTVDDPQGLVAWWPGNNSDLEILNGYDAIQGNGETYTTNGKVASAFTFNGVNNYVWMLAQSNYNVGPSATGFTLEFWMNPYTFQNTGVLGWANGVRIERFTIGVQTGDSLRFDVGGTGASNSLSANFIWITPSITNQWYHIAMTYDRTLGQAKIYTNGVLVASGSVGTAVLSTAGDFYLGQVPGTAGLLNGALDEVSIYSRPLNPEEVYNLFASGSAGKCPNDANQPPTVHAGADLFVRGIPATTALQGLVTDDGLPAGSTLRTTWSKVTGPGTVTFADPSSPVTSATFSTNGVYVLKLTADDSEAQASDLVEVRVESLCTVDNIQGLAAWWPGNGASDDVINGYHGLLGSGTTYTNGKVASAFSFNGVNNYVLMPAQSSYNVGTSAAGFTLEFWMNPYTIQNYGILGWANGVRVERITVGNTLGDTLRFDVGGTGSTNALNANFIWSTPVTNQWFHIAMTYDRSLGGLAKIYTNGVLVNTGNVGTNVLTTATDFYLGEATGSSTFFNGGLDEISIYNRPLDPEEVYNVFVSGSAGKCPNDANQAPVVFAGPNLTLSSTNNVAALNGVVSDDGLPTGSTLRTTWSKVSGPGTINFANASNAVTTATFATNGVYVLQLTADDGEAKNSSLTQVRVGVSCTVTDPSGLVAYWPGNGQPDEFINGYQSILGSGTTFTNGKVNSAFTFNGVNNYVWIPAQTNYNIGPSAAGFTLEFWMNPYSFQTAGVLGWTNGVRVERITSGLAQGDSLRFDVAGTGSGQAVTAAFLWITPAATNQWYHIGLTYDRTLGQAKIYTNGVLVATGTVGTNVLSTAGDLYLGEATGSSVFFYGGLDEISLYSRPLAQSEIQAIFNTGANGKCVTPHNRPPGVFAGGNHTVTFPTNTITLPGAAYDDGLPSNVLAVAWNYVSGPATIFFGSTNTPVTTITFTNTGIYTFQLSATDGQYTTNDTAVITVLPDPRIPPTVAITSPTSGDAFEVPNASATTNITITASASDADGVVTRVDIFQDNTLLTTLTNAPYSVTASNVGVGRHTFTAVATDNDGLSTTSTVSVTVYVDTLPTAIIYTPDDAARITAPTNIIATATSPILQSYQLQYRFKAPEDAQPNPWITLKTGSSSIVSNTLALFDPTLRLNGIYEMQLIVTDTKGRSTKTDFVTLLVSRNLKIGNFTLSFSDLTVPLAGVPIQIIRTYDSRDQRTNDFGVGWSLDIHNIRLQKTRNLGANWFSTFQTPWYSLDSVQPRRITVTLAGDKAYEFESVLTPSEQFGAPIASTRMTFTNLPGTYGTLEIDGDNKADVAGSLGFINLIDFTTSDYFNPTLFKFTTAEGDVYVIDEKEGLKSMTDRNGNTLTITTNGIFHSSGVSVAFTRDPQGRITAITDPAGNQLVYNYGTNGSLASFTDREAMTTIFAYTNAAFPHYLTEITDPRGVKAIRTEFDDSGRMIRQIDGSGNVINFTHDLAHSREVIVDRLGNPTVHEYDDRGNVLRTTDALGNVTTHVYDDVDNELQKIDALGNTNLFTYDANGNKLTETDPLGFTTRYTYGPFRVLTSIKNARGFTSTNAYDSDTGNLLQQTDALGNITSYSYDGAGNLLTQTDALGNIASNRYDSVGHVTNTVIIDPSRGVLSSIGYGYDTNGNQISKAVKRTTAGGGQTLTTLYQYDKNNRLLRTIYPDGSGNTTVYALGLDKPASETDALGHQTLHFYDERGNVTNTVFADATSESTLYDAENRKIELIDRGGRAMFYTNDALGRLTAVQLPDGAVTNTFYDAIGRIIATLDERGNVTRYAYDPNCGCSGRQAYITNALGQVTHREYDENANESAMTDALGRTTTYIYDQLDRRTFVVYSDGTRSVTTYDALGRRIAETDQNTNTTYFGYDGLSRLIAVTDALGEVTSYSYDEQGSLVAQTDANSHTTRFEYDSVGRRTKRTLPLGQFETYHYDLAGNLTSKVDFNGRTTTYGYDAVNRLLSKTPDAYFNAPPVVFTYTATGQRATMSDASGGTTYGYNSRDFLTNKTWTPAGQSFSLALNYTYDPHGDVSRIHSTSVNGVDVSYGYDPLNRLQSVSDVHSGATTYTYDDVGNLAGYTYPNGLASTYQYDSLNRLTNLTTLNSQLSTIASYRYTVAPTGHRLTASENLATTNGVRTINRMYSYDSTYRLVNESYAVGGPVALPPSANVSYTLDDVGNRLTRTSSLPGVENQIFSYNADDRLTTDTYDSNGNTVAGHITSSAPAVSDQYDFEDHLINRNNGQVTIAYDGDGSRVAKLKTGSTTFFLVDDHNPTGYAQVLEELTITIPATPTVNRVYAYGSALISQQLLSGFNPQPSTWFYGHDGHGSIRYLTTSTGEISDSYDYDAFGALISQTGVTPNIHLYCAEQFDADLGLYYNRARYLNSDVGRFWSRDKFETARLAPETLHRYLYGSCDPINRIDPNGALDLTIGSLTITLTISADEDKSEAEKDRRAFNNVRRGLCKAGASAIENLHHVVPMFLGGRNVESNLSPLPANYHTELHQLLHYALKFAQLGGGNVSAEEFSDLFNGEGGKSERDLAIAIVLAVSEEFDKACVPKGTQPVTPKVQAQIEEGQWNF